MALPMEGAKLSQKKLVSRTRDHPSCLECPPGRLRLLPEFDMVRIPEKFRRPRGWHQCAEGYCLDFDMLTDALDSGGFAHWAD